MSVVITHPEMGIYIGSCMGMGFWSLLDPAGQSSAVLFETEAAARDYVAGWDNENNPDQFSYRDVTSTSSEYATVAELKAAGLGAVLGEMEVDALRYAEPPCDGLTGSQIVGVPSRLSVQEEALLVRIAHETPHVDVRRYALAILERSKEQRA